MQCSEVAAGAASLEPAGGEISTEIAAGAVSIEAGAASSEPVGGVLSTTATPTVHSQSANFEQVECVVLHDWLGCSLCGKSYEMRRLQGGHVCARSFRFENWSTRWIYAFIPQHLPRGLLGLSVGSVRVRQKVGPIAAASA